MLSPSSVLRAAAVAAGACLFCASVDAQVTPISASGWNRDIVVENTAVTPYAAYALSFDTFNNISWFERNLPGSTKGLPVGGSFTSVTSPNITVQLQPYTAPNALFLDAASPTGTLTLDPAGRRAYNVLAVFASSSNGGGTGTLVITFTDNTVSSAINFNAQDWFNVTTNNAINDLGRVSLATNTFDERTGNPRIYQTVIDMVALGLNTRAVQSIAFTKPVATGAQNTVIMAISGQPTPGTSGACAFADGTCALLPQANCTGAYQGDNTTCPPAGACIAANGDCTLRTSANCTFVGGTFQGTNSTCPAAGACIAANGDCTQLNSFQCAFQHGNFLGAGQACPGSGACCRSGGQCTVLNSFQCAFVGGNFQGAGTVCALTYPAITVGGGALEDISATGTEVAWTTGTNDDGYAQVPIGFSFPFFSNAYTDAFVGTNGLLTFGAGSTAYANEAGCPAPNAGAPNNAIFPSWDDFHIGSATLAHPGRVYTQTLSSPNRFIAQWNRVGQYNAGQVPTDENTFEVVLFENGNIELRYGAITAQAACDATVGIEDAAGATGLNFDNTQLGTGGVSLAIAAVSPCPTTTGACCNAGVCTVTASGSCSGAYQGDGSACSPNPCAPATGACCCGSHCSLTTAANCSGTGRVFTGGGTSCTPFSNTAPCCRGDYNKSGGAASVQDIFDFLSGYFTNDACADTNDSGTVSVQDIFDFLSAYFGAGC